MAEPSHSYLIDQDGNVVAYAPDEALGLLGVGYSPAGSKQIEDFKREQAFHEKFGTTGQQLKTFGEGAAQSLTLGGSTWIERGLGVNPEDIKGRHEENPGFHLAGSITGVALPLVLSAGASALPESVAGAAELSAPGLVSKLGEVGSEGVSSLLGEHATTALGRITAKAASAGVGSAIEGAAYGLGQVVHESALGDPNLTASRALEEVGLSALLGGGIGAGTGVLGQLVGEVSGSKLGQKVEEWADRFEGNQNIKTAAGQGKGQSAFKQLYKRMSPEEASKLGREAGELGLIGPLDRPASVFEKASQLQEEVGPKISNLLQAADATGDAAPKSMESIIGRARKEILAPLAENPLEAPTANRLGQIFEAEEKRFGTSVGADGKRPLSFGDLHKLRSEVSDKIYGLRGVADPEATAFKSALHDFRSILSEEIENGLDKASLPRAQLSEWKTLNRQYHVASTISNLAEKGMAGAGLSGVPLTSTLMGGFGLIHGGFPTALGLGAVAKAAKVYGPQVLAAGARAVRQLVDDGAAEGLASKTADAIAAARKVGGDAVPEIGAATRAQGLWNKLSEHLGEPVGAPTKDLLRDTAQEHLAEGGHEGTPVETVAALSHLERANQRVQNRIEDGASALVRAAPRVARGEVMAGVANAFAKDPTNALEAHTKRAEKIRQLANNPAILQQRLVAATDSLEPHAPQASHAIQVAMSRSVAALNNALGPPPPHAPLQKPEPPGPDKVAAFQRVFDAVQKPSVLLKQAAAGTLTPDAIAAVKTAHPQQFGAIQQAVLQKLTANRQPIPYNQRQMIGLLLGQDMDGTASPAAIQAHQSVFVAPAPQQPGIKPTSKALEKLHLSQRMLTPAQASASRGTGGD